MILVTTAGKVGAHAARKLAAIGQPVRLLVREPIAHQNLAAVGVELFHGDLDRPDSVAAAVAGIHSVVLVTPAMPAHEIAIIEAARNAGVGHVTKVTSDAAPDSPIGRRRDHFRIEQVLSASGIPHTLLRANAYMQNLLALAPKIAATSAFSSSTEDGRIGMVDARDVAQVAAMIAADPTVHIGKTYRLSGPATLSYDDVAFQLSRILGHTITHRRITAGEQKAAMVELGIPEPVARANALALTLFAAGDSDWISPHVEQIAGRPAISFSTFATDHIERFLSPVG